MGLCVFGFYKTLAMAFLSVRVVLHHKDEAHLAE